MNVLDEIDEGYRYEMERKRRISYARKNALKRAIRKGRVELSIGIALLVGFVVFMIWWNMTQPLRERAAYLEGRYDLDHATAMKFAESEVR